MPRAVPDVSALSRAYCHPNRQMSPEVQHLIDSSVNDGNLWDEFCIRGLLPAEFSSNTSRRFGSTKHGQSIWPTSRPTELIRPDSRVGIAALLSDLDGILAAESLARELNRRLVPWGAFPLNRIIWYFTNINYEVSYLGSPYESVIDALGDVLDEPSTDIHSLIEEELIATLPPLLRDASRAYSDWMIASNLKLQIKQTAWSRFSSGVRFSDLNNPFESLLRFWGTGYRIVSDFTQNEPGLRLYAPV